MQRGAERFVDEMLARVRRAGHDGRIVIRADSGFENHKLLRVLDRAGVEFSIGVEQTKQVRELIAEIPDEGWVTIEDYPDTGQAQIAETKLNDWRLVVRRTRFVGAQVELWPDWRHHTFATNRTVPTLVADIDHRDHTSVELTIRDLKDQALAHLPSGRYHANSAWTVIAAIAHNLARWTILIGTPTAPPHAAGICSRSPAADPNQPPMDPPLSRPLAMEDGLPHRARRDPRGPRTSLNPTAGHHPPSHTRLPRTGQIAPATQPAEKLPPGFPRHETDHDPGTQRTR